MQRMYKKYIEVEMLVDKMAEITPLTLIWNDERYFVNNHVALLFTILIFIILF